MSHYIAVDIGGTQLRAACYPADSITPIVIDRTPTRHPTESTIDRLIGLIKKIWPKSDDVLAVGVAAPGPLDPYEGVVIEAPNVPGWVDLPLRARLEECLNAPVLLGNDANLAAMGEWKYGAGRGHNDLVYLTVSTGIGGGVITGGQMLLGQRGLAAELGHITVDPNGPMCGCGARGHLEAFAAGPGMAAWTRQEIERGVPSSLPAGVALTGKMVGEAARAGDPLAQAAVARSGVYIGRAAADFLHIFNPSIIIIGGGVSQLGPMLLDPLWDALQQNVLSPGYLTGLKLTTAELGDEAGLVGALALARSYS